MPATGRPAWDLPGVAVPLLLVGLGTVWFAMAAVCALNGERVRTAGADPLAPGAHAEVQGVCHRLGIAPGTPAHAACVLEIDGVRQRAADDQQTRALLAAGLF
jgi:hypothetical protein